MRLGIRRGWRVKMFNDAGLYTPSLVHCMFLFVLMRMKALRLNLWIVGYYVFYIADKVTIYAFVWFLPTRSVSKIFGKLGRFRLRIGVATNKLYLSRTTLVSVAAVPAKKLWLRFRREQATLVGRSALSSTVFAKIWDIGGSLLRFFIARSMLTINKLETLPPVSKRGALVRHR